MIRKPTSGDSEQREHESERARRSSTLSPVGGPQDTRSAEQNEDHTYGTRPMHGSSEGESAHGALPRRGIEFEQGD
jgi:hypothetical protein